MLKMGLPFFSKKKDLAQDNFLPKLDLNDIRRVAKSSGRSKKDVLEEELISELNKDLKEIRENTLENPKEESYDEIGVIEKADKTPVRNLSELVDFAKNLQESDFKKFVNPKFNLFSEFAQENFGQIGLSVELALLTNRQDTVSKLQAFLISEGNISVIEKPKNDKKGNVSKEDKSNMGFQKKIVKETAKKILMSTAKEKGFVFSKIKVNSLEDLSKTMNSLSLRSVIKEIENRRIELADWIEKAIGDSELANRVLNNYEPKNVINAIEERIRFLKKVIEDDDTEEESVVLDKTSKTVDDKEESNFEKEECEDIKPLVIHSKEINDIPELINYISGLDDDDFDSKIKSIKKEITDWIVKITREEDLSTLVFSNNKSDFLEKIESARYSLRGSTKKKSKKSKVSDEVKTSKKKEDISKSQISENQNESIENKNEKTYSEEQNSADVKDVTLKTNSDDLKKTVSSDSSDNVVKSDETEKLVTQDTEKKEQKIDPDEAKYQPKDTTSDFEKETKTTKVPLKKDKGFEEVGFFDDETEKKVTKLAEEIEEKKPYFDKAKNISEDFDKDIIEKINKDTSTTFLPAPSKPDEIKQPKNEYLSNLVKTNNDDNSLKYSNQSEVIKNRSDLIDSKTKSQDDSLNELPSDFLDNEKNDYIAFVEDKKKIEDKVDLLYNEQLSSNNANKKEISLPENPNDDFIDSIEKKNIESREVTIPKDNQNPFEAKEINKYFKEYANAAKQAISLNVKEMESAIELKKEEIKLLNETIESKRFMIETDIKEQVKGFNELKDKLTEEIRSLLKEKDELKLQVDSLKGKVNGSIDIDSDEIINLKSVIEELNKKLKEQEEIISAYQNRDFNNGSDSKQGNDSIYQKINNEYVCLKEKYLKLEAENKKLSESNAFLEKGLSPKEKAVINFSELKSELESTKKELNKRKNELGKVIKDMELKQVELNNLILDIGSVNNIKLVREELKSESKKLENIKKEVELKEIELNNAKKLLESANDDYKMVLESKKLEESKLSLDISNKNINDTINQRIDTPIDIIEDKASNDVKVSEVIQPNISEPSEELPLEINSNVDKSFEELLDGISGNKPKENLENTANNLDNFEDIQEDINVKEKKDENSLDEGDFNNKLSEVEFSEPIKRFNREKASERNKEKRNKISVKTFKKNELDNDFVPDFDKELGDVQDTFKKDLDVTKEVIVSSKNSKKKKNKLNAKNSDQKDVQAEDIESRSKKLLDEIEKDVLMEQKEAQVIDNKGGEIINKESFGKKPKPVDTYVKTIDTLEDVYDAIREARNMVDIRKFDDAQYKIDEIEEAVLRMKLGSTDKKRIEVEVRLLKLEVEIS